MKRLELFDPPYTIWTSGACFPGGKRRRLYLMIKYNFILLYFNLSNVE